MVSGIADSAIIQQNPSTRIIKHSREQNSFEGSMWRQKIIASSWSCSCFQSSRNFEVTFDFFKCSFYSQVVFPLHNISGIHPVCLVRFSRETELNRIYIYIYIHTHKEIWGNWLIWWWGLASSKSVEQMSSKSEWML